METNRLNYEYESPNEDELYDISDVDKLIWIQY